MANPRTVHLHSGGTSVVFDVSSADQPIIVYWGPELVGAGEASISAIAEAAIPQKVSGGQDVTPRLTLFPVPAGGWLGTPGLKMTTQVASVLRSSWRPRR